VETLLGSPVSFVLPGNASDSYVTFLNGSVQTYPLTTSQATSGFSTITVTPTGTGVLQVGDPVSGALTPPVNVVATLSSNLLTQIQGAVMGSFMWDKAAGTLTLYTTNGSVLSSYTISDQPTVFSRELLP